MKLSSRDLASTIENDNILHMVEVNVTAPAYPNGRSVRVTLAQLKSFFLGSVEGSLKIIGFWDADTNTPDLSALTLNQGEAYQVSVGGATNLNGETNWKAKDLVVWSDTLAGNYFKIDNTDDVFSVAGKTGAVTLDTGDVTEITNKNYVTDAEKTILSNTSNTNTGDETATSLGALTNSLTEKNPLVNDDMFSVMDSAAGNIWKKYRWSNLVAQVKAYFDTLYNYFGYDTVPSANALPLSQYKEYHLITGATEIQTISDAAFKNHTLKFTGTPNLKHSANLILPTGADIQTAAGDTAQLRYEGGSVWRVINYQKADGTPLAGGGGGGFSITDITYAALKALYDGGTMVKGFYRITDFATIYDQPDFDAGGNVKLTLVTKTAATEPIIVFAISATELAAEAYQEAYPKDKIKYDITYNLTEHEGAAAKGRIFERIDEAGNRTDYDHRTILFIRYETAPASGQFLEINDNGGASIETKTFENIGGENCNNIWINDFTKYMGVFGFDPDYPILANNVISGGALGGSETWDCTIRGITFNNTFPEGMLDVELNGQVNTGNIMGGGMSMSKIFGNFQNNICHGNTIASVICNGDFQDNTITAGNLAYLTINSRYEGNTSSQNINYCSFDTFSNNTINGYMSDCKFEIGTSINACTFPNNFRKNIFETGIYGALDFTLSTYVLGNYTCWIWERQDGAQRLTYYDNTDTLQVVTSITS